VRPVTAGARATAIWAASVPEFRLRVHVDSRAASWRLFANFNMLPVPAACSDESAG